MSRRDEVEAIATKMREAGESPFDDTEWDTLFDDAVALSLTLAAEVDQRDATITALLEMLRPEPKINYECRFVDFCKHEDRRKLLELLHARALEIAWRTE